jgi:hypothetical protein
MPAPAIVLLVAVVLIVGAIVYYLLATILELRKVSSGLDSAIEGVVQIIEKTAPVEPVVADINANLDAAVDALEGLLVKKAGLNDAMGLIDGLYPGAAAEGLRNFPGSGEIKPPRVAEVYTRGVLTLARLGREAPIAAVSPDGPVLRHASRAASEVRALYPDLRQTRPDKLPTSPTIGTDSPVQYEVAPTPGVRPRQPAGSAGPKGDE